MIWTIKIWGGDILPSLFLMAATGEFIPTKLIGVCQNCSKHPQAVCF